MNAKQRRVAQAIIHVTIQSIDQKLAPSGMLAAAHIYNEGKGSPLDKDTVRSLVLEVLANAQSPPGDA